MNKIMMGLLLSAFFGFKPLEAYIDVCYETNSCYDCTWAVGLDALYWKPCSTEAVLTESIADTFVGTSQYGTFNPSYHFGFDISLIKEIPSCSASVVLNWVHVNFKDTYLNAKVDDVNINTYFENHVGKSKIDFDRVNLRALEKLNSTTSLSLDGFVGVSFLHVNQNQANSFDFFLNNVLNLGNNQESFTFNGGLGELGLRGKATLCPANLYFLGEVGLLTGIGNRKIKATTSYEEVGSTANTRQINEISDCACFTGVEYKFELGFAGKCYCFKWNIHAGYEGLLLEDFSLYFLPNSIGEEKRAVSNLGFAGPYLGATLYLPF